MHFLIIIAASSCLCLPFPQKPILERTSCLPPLISQKETEQPVPGLNRLASFMPEKALARR